MKKMTKGDTMARPSNHTDTTKKHLTKEEIDQRKQGELALLSGIEIRISETTLKDKIAKQEFERVLEILTAVGKNDALYEAVINDYCMYKSDIERYTKYRKNAEKDIKSLEKMEIDPIEKFKIKDNMQKNIGNYDRQIQTFQKKRFDIEKETGFTVASALRSIPKKYVDCDKIAIIQGTDPIFKYSEIYVEGKRFNHFDFLKILRNSKNGVSGTSLVEENQKILAVGYYGLKLECNSFKRGGAKKGFLLAGKRLESNALAELRQAFTKLYEEDNDHFIILQNGMEFKEASATQVELQLNQSKTTNVNEFAKLFHISASVISGESTDTKSLAKLAAIPLMDTIQKALDASLLLEVEKKDHYFAFDKKELLKGEMQCIQNSVRF